ncbi:hypothetical protein [Pantoea endophytica]|uniref:hypothetical protein n=1 Tax=Pantoea endophytica TaxID=92488 RepID=UPI003017F3EF
MKENKKIIGAVLFFLVFIACFHASSSIAMQPNLTSIKQGDAKEESPGHNITSGVTRQIGQQQANAAASKAPPESHNLLIWSAKGNILSVTNTGLFTSYLQKEIKLLPDNMPGTLEKPFILPGETLIVYGVCKHHLPTQTSVLIEAMAKDGTDLGSKIIPVSR